MTGTPERLGGDPRGNADDAYATFMDMDDDQWRGLLQSLGGQAFGKLEMAEYEGFERAFKDRLRMKSGPTEETWEVS